MAASICSADLPLAQMMKMWPYFASYRRFHSASSCSRGSRGGGQYAQAVAAASSEHSRASGLAGPCLVLAAEKGLGCVCGGGSGNAAPAPHAPSAHLQHALRGPRRRSLLPFAQLCKAAKLFTQPLQVANLGVGGKRLQPARHWGLQGRWERCSSGGAEWVEL